MGNKSTGSGSWVCDSCHTVIGQAPVMGTCPGCNTEQPVAESGVCIVCGTESVTPGLASAGPHTDASFRRLRALMESDPEWHDGEIVFARP